MTRPLLVADAPAADAPAADALAPDLLAPSATTEAKNVGRPGPIGELRAAVGMLTRVPLPGPPAAGTGAPAFAIVGALLGLTALMPLVVLGTAVPVAAAILAIAVVAILSGGLHLDGLADTFDALVAVGPEAAERARRDPAVGAAGATALILVLGLDVAALASLLASRGPVFGGLACVVAASVSRLVPVVLARLARSAAADAGLGAWFVRRTRRGDVAVAVTTGLALLAAVSIAVGSWSLAIGGVAGGAASVGLGLSLVRLRRTIDGDLLGASVELAFASTVVAIAALAAWSLA
jgi:adenosylcobinamide-GDP ribazoletransferase